MNGEHKTPSAHGTEEQKLAELEHLANEVIRTDNGYSANRAFIAAISPERAIALVDCARALSKALRESGCDGDLCNYAWHEAARSALAAWEQADG